MDPHPGNRAPLKRETGEKCHKVFQRFGDLEAAMRQKTMVGQTNADAVDQPVQEQKTEKGRPGEIKRRQERSGMDENHPGRCPEFQLFRYDQGFAHKPRLRLLLASLRSSNRSTLTSARRRPGDVLKSPTDYVHYTILKSARKPFALMIDRLNSAISISGAGQKKFTPHQKVPIPSKSDLGF